MVLPCGLPELRGEYTQVAPGRDSCLGSGCTCTVVTSCAGLAITKPIKSHCAGDVAPLCVLLVLGIIIYRFHYYHGQQRASSIRHVVRLCVRRMSWRSNKIFVSILYIARPTGGVREEAERWQGAWLGFGPL